MKSARNSKKRYLIAFAKAFEEVQLAEQGKIRLKTFEQLIAEI